MCVRIAAVVEMVSARCFEHLDLAIFRKEGKVAIDGTAADAVVMPANLTEHLVCGGMVMQVSDGFEDQFALTGVASLDGHGVSYRYTRISGAVTENLYDHITSIFQ